MFAMILCKVLKHSAFIRFETVTVMNVVMQKCCLNYNNVVQLSTFWPFHFIKKTGISMFVKL